MKFLCLFFFLFAWTYTQAQSSSVVQSTVENILLGKAASIQPNLASGFELNLRGQIFSITNNPMSKLQAFLNQFPCTSLQITNPGGNPANGDFRSNSQKFRLTLYVSGGKLQKMILQE